VKDDKPINIPYVVRKMELLCEYPPSPADYFLQRSKEITSSPAVVGHVRELFNLPRPNGLVFLPGEITKICTSYYEHENVETMISDTLRDCRFFANGNAITQLFRSATPYARPTLMQQIRALSARCASYIWWFLLRSRVPLFVPMNNFTMERLGPRGYRLLDHHEEGVASFIFEHVMWGKLQRRQRNEFGETDSDTDGEVNSDAECETDCDGSALLQSVLHADLIGPCLNTSSVTLEQVKACSIALESRTKARRHKWLSFLFDLFPTYAAIELWVSNAATSAEAKGPKAEQRNALVEWNRFYNKYRFGRRFCVPCHMSLHVTDYERSCHFWPRTENDFQSLAEVSSLAPRVSSAVSDASV
jgi:hypothetical protein